VQKLTRSIINHTKLYGIIFLALFLASVVYGSSLVNHLVNGGFQDKNSESAQFTKVYQKNFPKAQADGLVLVQSDSETVQDPRFRQAVEGLTKTLEKDPDVGMVSSYYSTGSPNLISKDQKSALLTLALKGDQDKQLLTATRLHDKLQINNFKTLYGGPSFVNYEVNEQVKKDIAKAETIAIPIVMILLLFVFRGVVAASLPLLIGLASVLGAFALTRLVTEFTDVSVYSANVINFLSLGLAIDYSLLMVSRFREELTRQPSVNEAIVHTVTSAGKAIAFSASIVALGMLSMLIFPQLFLKSMGIGGAASVVVSVILALFVLPIIFKLLGHRVNKWSMPITGMRHDREQGLLWKRTAEFVMRNPILVLIVTLATVLLLAAPVRNIKLGYPTIDSMPTSFQSKQLNNILLSDFPNISSTPAYVLVTSEHDSWQSSDLSTLASYADTIKTLPSVESVQSPTTVGIQTLQQVLTGTKTLPAAQQAAILSQINGNQSLLQVRFSGGAISDQAQALIKSIRDQKPNGQDVMVGGTSAEFVDLLASIRAHLLPAILVIVISTFVLMSLLLGSFVLPLKALILNVISLSAAFGVLVWVFQYGHFASWFGISATGPIDSMNMVLIFAIAFGLAMDYEVFLVSRIKEYHDQTGDTRHSVAMGLAKTGPIITSAALLLVVVIGAFAAGEMSLVKQIGIGLGIGILLDATIVRAFIVPASMETLGRYNWWAPKSWKALSRKFDIKH
jgi:uncharacterized membrane protein YdfJ with MMPL/SSD domain